MHTKLMSAGLLIAFGAAAFAGCGKSPTKTNAPPKTVSNSNADDGWWCDEHGVPEAECSMCSLKVAKELKAKGDWCDEHERAKSQCFLCDPSLREKSAARYRAKYGKEPPEPTENQPPKKGEKKEEPKG